MKTIFRHYDYDDFSKVFMLIYYSHSKRMKNWSEGQVLFFSI